MSYQNLKCKKYAKEADLQEELRRSPTNELLKVFSRSNTKNKPSIFIGDLLIVIRI